MRTIPHVAHPDVIYWTCPEGDCRVVVTGATFDLMVTMGQLVETSDLADVLPLSELESGERLVEQHEQQHLGGTS